MKQLRLIYWMILGSQFVFFAIIVVLKNTMGVLMSEETEGFQLIKNFMPIAALAVIPVGYMLSAQFMKPLKQKADPEPVEIFSTYKKAMLVNWALLEGATALSLIGYWMTAHPQFLIIFLIGLIVFFINKPSYVHIGRQLDLNHNQTEELKEKIENISFE